MGYCKLQIIGNLGQDCRVNLVGGKQVLNLSVCYTEKWKDNNGVQKEKSLWIDAAYWNESAAIAQYLKKGQQIMLEGIPDVRTYENSNRQTIAQMTLRVNQLVLLGSSNRDNNSSSQPNAAGHTTQQGASDISVPDPTLPF